MKYSNLAKGAPDIIGQTFGKWTVESRAGTWGRSASWWCVDVDGNKAIKTTDYLKESVRKKERNARKANAASADPA